MMSRKIHNKVKSGTVKLVQEEQQNIIGMQKKPQNVLAVH